MTACFFLLAVVFVLTEMLHFRRERELIRRLIAKDEREYVSLYEERPPRPPSQAKEAMKRWKTGQKG